MRQTGNIKSNQHYNANEVRNPPPTNMVDSERDGELEKFIRDKYEYKRFVSKSAIVAQHLGPSRSAASVRSSTSPTTAAPVRSQTTPLTNPSYTSSSSSPSVAGGRAPVGPSAALRAPPARTASQPVAQPPPPNTTPGGVWNDLLALQNPGQPQQQQTPSLPLQYQPSASTQPVSIPGYASNNTLTPGSYNGGGAFGAGLGTSPNFTSVSPGGAGLGGMGSSPFQSQIQTQTQLSSSPFNSGQSVGNPFPLAGQQQQQQQPQFLSSSPYPSQSTPFQSQSSSFGTQQPMPPVQQPMFTQAQGNPFFNGTGQDGRMLTPQPQMPFQSTPSPAPFGAQFAPQSSPFQQQQQQQAFQQQPQQSFQRPPTFQQQTHTPFQQQPQFQQPLQQQPQYGGGMNTGAAANPFTSWMTQPPGGKAGQWGSM
ncbi:hypothetical protein BV25DRAFT_1282159 [Artomyces pyxidatus]|uniref:Uncharacterized protein n=1 Tax=Artomyces pyxidatus TaxID=48021 RepID=A0ACB8SQF4_9AGAM|nr:hypothetical protein BV25DRAFT_1282159 [Artomyces pyxidatus]